MPEGGTDYETVAALTVDGRGRYVLDDPQELMPTDLHVLVPDADRGLRPVRFEEDPETRARNLHTVLRTGYLVPARARRRRRAGRVSQGPEELTRDQVAELVGVRPATWSGYVSRGQAPAPSRSVGRTPAVGPRAGAHLAREPAPGAVARRRAR